MVYNVESARWYENVEYNNYLNRGSGSTEMAGRGRPERVYTTRRIAGNWTAPIYADGWCSGDARPLRKTTLPQHHDLHRVLKCWGRPREHQDTDQEISLSMTVQSFFIHKYFFIYKYLQVSAISAHFFFFRSR